MSSPPSGIDWSKYAKPVEEPGVDWSKYATLPDLHPSEDEDYAVRTIIGEAKNEGELGWQAVAGVINNRARLSGKRVKDVVLAKNQFEPWHSRRSELESYDPNSPTYRAVAAAALPVLRGEADDPTGGATHFYGPRSQAQLGRKAPDWDNGQGFDIGNHRFFRLKYGGKTADHGIDWARYANDKGTDPTDPGVDWSRYADNGAVAEPSADPAAPAGTVPGAAPAKTFQQPGEPLAADTPPATEQDQLRADYEAWRTKQGLDNTPDTVAQYNAMLKNAGSIEQGVGELKGLSEIAAKGGSMQAQVDQQAAFDKWLEDNHKPRTQASVDEFNQMQIEGETKKVLEDNPNYAEYLKAAGKTDSPESRAEYTKVIQPSIDVANKANAAAAAAAQSQVVKGAAKYADKIQQTLTEKSPAQMAYDAAAREYNAGAHSLAELAVQQQRDAGAVLDPQTNKPLFVTARSNKEILDGSAGSVPVDYKLKPAGMNSGLYGLTTALRDIAPQYGLTEEDIQAQVQAMAAQGRKYSRVTNDLTDEDWQNQLKIGHSGVMQFGITNGLINEMLRRKNHGDVAPDQMADDKIEPQLNDQIHFQQSLYQPLDPAQNEPMHNREGWSFTQSDYQSLKDAVGGSEPIAEYIASMLAVGGKVANDAAGAIRFLDWASPSNRAIAAIMGPQRHEVDELYNQLKETSEYSAQLLDEAARSGDKEKAAAAYALWAQRTAIDTGADLTRFAAYNMMVPGGGLAKGTLKAALGMALANTMAASGKGAKPKDVGIQAAIGFGLGAALHGSNLLGSFLGSAAARKFLTPEVVEALNNIGKVFTPEGTKAYTEAVANTIRAAQRKIDEDGAVHAKSVIPTILRKAGLTEEDLPNILAGKPLVREGLKLGGGEDILERAKLKAYLTKTLLEQGVPIPLIVGVGFTASKLEGKDNAAAAKDAGTWLALEFLMRALHTGGSVGAKDYRKMPWTLEDIQKADGTVVRVPDSEPPPPPGGTGGEPPKGGGGGKTEPRQNDQPGTRDIMFVADPDGTKLHTVDVTGLVPKEAVDLHAGDPEDVPAPPDSFVAQPKPAAGAIQLGPSGIEPASSTGAIQLPPSSGDGQPPAAGGGTAEQGVGPTQTLSHPDPQHDGKEIIGYDSEGKAIVVTPENKTGVSHLTDQSGASTQEPADTSLTVSTPASLLTDEPKSQTEDEFMKSIIGEKGVMRGGDTDMQMRGLEIAKEMATKKMDAKKIWFATGWEQGKDGKWRTELDPQKIKFDYVPVDDGLVGLDEFIDAPELFKAYPQLKDLNVHIPSNYHEEYEQPKTAGGHFSAADNLIAIDGSMSLEAVQSAVRHEVQHAIQNIEGFTAGTNPRHEKLQAALEVQSKRRALHARINELIGELGLPRDKDNIAHGYKDAWVFPDFETRGLDPSAPGKWLKEWHDMGSPRGLDDPMPDWLGNWVIKTDATSGGKESLDKFYTRGDAVHAAKSWAEKPPTTTGDLDRFDPRARELKRLLKEYNKRQPSDKILTERGRDRYNRNAGEVEARNVEKRANLSPEQRRLNPPSETEDVPRKKQIVGQGDGIATSEPGIFEPPVEPESDFQKMSRAEKEAEIRRSSADQTNTPEFKKFFGKSTVVDKDGRPLRVYHGTPVPEDFTEFASGNPRSIEDEHGNSYTEYGSGADPSAYVGSNFTESAQVAGKFANGMYSRAEDAKHPRIIPTYIRIEKPLEFKSDEAYQDALYAVDPRSSYVDDYMEGEYGEDDDAIEAAWEKYDSDPEYRAKINRDVMDELGNEASPETGFSAAQDFAQELGEAFKKKAKASGYDGVVHINTVEGGGRTFVPFEPEQIKSSIGNRGTFDPNEDDITKSADGVPSKSGRSLLTDTPKKVAEDEKYELATRQPKGYQHLMEGSKPLIRFDSIPPEVLNKIHGILKTYPGLEKISSNPKKGTEYAINQMKDNLLWLIDQLPGEMRRDAMEWYDTGRKLTFDMSHKYGVARPQAAGMIAALSPGADWFRNVGLAYRIAGIMHAYGHATVDKEMLNWAKAGIAEAKVSLAQANTPKQILAQETLLAQRQKRLARLQAIKSGTPLSAMTNADAAYFVRSFDEMYGSRSYDQISPNGVVTGKVMTKANAEAQITWQTYPFIEKAISIYRDGSFENISKQLGADHKIRNFYNNILLPNSANGHVTIDTHQVAANLLLPLAQKDLEAKQGMSGSPSSVAAGTNGLYGLHHEVVTRAAQEMGWLPRQAQSVSWEGVRGLFSPGFKAREGNKQEIANVWSKGRDREEIRRTIYDRAGGIETPDWYSPDTQRSDQEQRADHPTQLPDLRWGKPGRTSELGAGDAPGSRVPVAGSEADEFQKSSTEPATEPDSLGFYSQAARTIDAKMPNKASADQVRSILSPANGVKKEELDWLDIDSFLADHPNPTKAEVLDFIHQNQVQIKEVMKGDVNDRGNQLTRAIRDAAKSLGVSDTANLEQRAREGESFEQALKSQFAYYDNPSAMVKKAMGNKALAKAYEDYRHLSADADAGGDTQYDDYVLPGGENYRELLLTLPEREAPRLTWTKDGPNMWHARRQDGGLFNINKKASGYDVFSPEGLVGNFLGTLEDAQAAAQRAAEVDKFGGKNYRSSHWSEPNVLAHIRFDDRTVDSKRILHIAEFQSDWHQAGRKQGYRGTEEARSIAEQKARDIEREKEVRAELAKVNKEIDRRTSDLSQFAQMESPPPEALVTAANRIGDLREQQRELLAESQALSQRSYEMAKGVPDAPFKKSWHELAMKRMIRYAAENGYDGLSWDTGETNAERYDLSKQVNYIGYKLIPKTGNIAVDIDLQNAFQSMHLGVDPNTGTVVQGRQEAIGKQLEDVVGKDVAEKILTDQGHEPDESMNLEPGFKALWDMDLKVGGEGMVGFYDKMLPRFVNKYVKKWGGKTVPGAVFEDGKKMGAFAKKSEALAAFRAGEKVYGLHGGEVRGFAGYRIKDEADLNNFRKWGRIGKGRHEAWHLDITPAMKESVVDEGQPMFSRIERVKNTHTSDALVQMSGGTLHPTGEIEGNDWDMEMFRRVIEAYRRVTPGSEGAFNGITIGNATIGRVVQFYHNELRPSLIARGFTDADLKPLDQFMQHTQALVSMHPTHGIVWSDPGAPRREEVLHRKERELGGVTKVAQRQLELHPLFLDPGTTFTNDYGHETPERQVSEMAAKLETGQAAKYGWDTRPDFENERDSFLNIWANGIVDNAEALINEMGYDAFVERYEEIARHADITQTSDSPGELESQGDPSLGQTDQTNGEATGSPGQGEEPPPAAPTASDGNAERPTEQGVSRAGQRLADEAVAEGITTALGDTAKYDKINVPDQAARATDLVQNDFETARAIMNGEQGPPEGLNPMSVFVALKQHAKDTGDADLVAALARSPLASDSSFYAQSLRMLREAYPWDPDSLVRQVENELKKGVDRKKTAPELAEALQTAQREYDRRLSELEAAVEQRAADLAEVQAKKEIDSILGEPRPSPYVLNLARNAVDKLDREAQAARDRLKASGFMKSVDEMLFSKLHHGSHRTDLTELSAEHAGTGEGGASHGHGIYLSNSGGVADAYRGRRGVNVMDSMDQMLIRGKSLWSYNVNPELHKRMLTYDRTRSDADWNALQRSLDTHLAAAKREVETKGTKAAEKRLKGLEEFKSITPDELARRPEPKHYGKRYTVDAPDDEHLFVWDKPLSSQSQIVQKGIRDLIENYEGVDLIDAGEVDPASYRTVGDLYEDLAQNHIGEEKQVSQDMRAFGILGNKYQDSRDGGYAAPGEDPWNYVLFDGRDAKILHSDPTQDDIMKSVDEPLDPAVLQDLATVGASHIAKLGTDPMEFRDAMVAEFGQGIEPHINEIYDAAKTQVDSSVVSPKLTRKLASAAPKKTVQQRIAGAIKRRADADITGLVQQLARTYVEKGVTDRQTLLDNVHNDLQSIDPKITRRETMDMISGYGKYRQLSKEQAAITLRDLKGQLQQIAKLEDMAQGEAPKKTGAERRTPSDEERRLIQQVEEAKKQGGYNVTDPATQLRTALGAAKTRLRNQIRDLEEQIRTRQKIVKTRTQLQYDAEATRLRRERDQLKQDYEAVFGKATRNLTDAQRLDLWKRNATRRLTAIQEKLANGDYAVTPKKPRVPLDDQAQQMETELDRMKERLTDLRKVNGQLSQDEIEGITRQAALVDATYQDLINDPNYSPTGEGETAATTEKRLAYGMAKLNLDLHISELKDKARKDTRSGADRTVDVIHTVWNTPMSVLTFGHGGVIPFTHGRSSLFVPGEIKIFGRAAGRSYSYSPYFRREGAIQKWKQDMSVMVSHPDYDYWKKRGLDIKVGEKPLAMGSAIWTQMSFDALKMMRFDLALKYAKDLGGNLTDEEAKDLAARINHVTGDLKTPPSIAKVASWVMFAPKMRFAKYLAAFVDPVRSKWAAKRMAKLIAVNLGLLLTNYMVNKHFFGVDDEDNVNFGDPSRADWLRGKVAGMTVPLAPQFEAAKLPARIGAAMVSPDDYDRWKAAKNEVVYALNPAIALLYGAVTGQDLATGKSLPFGGLRGAIYGEQPTSKRGEIKWPEYVGTKVAPLAFQPIIQELGQDGINPEMGGPIVEAFASGLFGEHLSEHRPPTKKKRSGH